MLIVAKVTGFQSSIFKKDPSTSALSWSTGFVFATLTMLLVDNFTYTIFGVGIGDVGGVWLIAISGMFLLAVFRLTNETFKWQSALIKSQRATKICGVVVFSMLLVKSIATLGHWADSSAMDIVGGNLKTKDSPPNIVIIGSDGIAAAHMSFYGHNRKTTPNLDQLRNEALIFENAFTNAAQTTGSLTSMLTGKIPTTTKVLSVPHVLEKGHARQHLPGLLREVGYYNLQRSPVHFADAQNLNFINGFHNVNTVDQTTSHEAIPKSFDLPIYFLKKVSRRVNDRFFHLIGQKVMLNPYHQIEPNAKNTNKPSFSDKKTIAELSEKLKTTPRPFFAHLHLIDGHCSYNIDICSMLVSQRVFSKSHSSTKRDLYDDVVLDSDRYIKMFMDELRKQGDLENTLFVIYSDHSVNHIVDKRVPLIFLFPRKEYVGIRTENVSLLDVAPTIVDYLELDVPSWMEGQSLLEDSLDRKRPIFSIRAFDRGVGPPLFGLRSLSMTLCNFQYTVDMKNFSIIKRATENSSACQNGFSLDKSKAKAMMIDHLRDRGFVISTDETTTMRVN